ncbi:MAG: hypothetical protein V1806_14200 [Pseudomonadota bacterium]
MNAISKVFLALGLAALLALGLASLASTQGRVPNPLLPPSQRGLGTALDPVGMEWSEAWDIVLDAPQDY